MRLQPIMTFVTTWEKNRGNCDREKVNLLDNIPYGEMPKRGQTARFLINTKQNLDLGLLTKKRKTVLSNSD